MSGLTKVKIQSLGPEDLGLLNDIAEDVFDDALNGKAAESFLSDPRHHIIVAIDGSTVIGFITAVHYKHPDKPDPELWINEVGVAPPYQRQGIATAMLQSLKTLAAELGCREAWVLTEKSNRAATCLYASCEGIESKDAIVMYSFDLRSLKS